VYNLNQYITKYHGMELDPVAQPDRRHNENGILFLVEYFILKYIHKTLCQEDINLFNEICINLTCFDEDGAKAPGVYDRGMEESLRIPRDQLRLISHDNLTAISCFARFAEELGYKTIDHRLIAQHGKKWQMRFDNAYPTHPRWLFKEFHTGLWRGTACMWHPRDIFCWLVNGGSKLAWILFPLFMLSNIISCSNAGTSGKWLSFVRLECGSKWSKLMWLNKKICYWILRRKYGKTFMDEIAKIYFYQSYDSPIRTLARNIEL
jgi:hypothetical protein